VTRKELSSDERLAWLRLSRTENIGPITFYKLLQRYGSATNALTALPELARRGGRKKPLQAFDAATAKREIEQLAKMDARLIAACEPDYPEALAATEDAPPLIAVLGHVHLLNTRCVAMVGARNASLNGRKMAEQLARDLGEAGYTIASGLARGIDTSSHIGALNTGTIAAVAGGLDVIYPKENTALFHEIAGRGAMGAESPLGTQIQARHFPRRNRIVSALSLGTIVVEAAPKSGSLITARMAADQGREVFAVPGSPLDPRAQGTNGLIKQGAQLIETAHDVLDVLEGLRTLPVSETDQPDFFSLSPPDTEPEIPEENMAEVRAVLEENLSPTPIAVDEVIRACHFSTQAVLTALLEMELAGRIKRHPGSKVSLAYTENEEKFEHHVQSGHR